MAASDGIAAETGTDRSAAAPVGTFAWRGGPGVLVYGLSAVALGLLGLYRGDFTIVFHPVPEPLPGRTALAYLAAVLLVAGGIGIQSVRFRKAAGLLLAVLFLLLGAQWLVRVVTFPAMIGTWVGWSEQLALALAGLMAALQVGRPAPRAVLACRIAFGLLQLVFGLGHFLSLPETVAMTPGWIPPGPQFWALATGALHLAGGVAFLTGFRPAPVAALLAAMFAGFALLVWLPGALYAPLEGVPWAGLVMTVALTGAMLVLFDLLRGVRPEIR